MKTGINQNADVLLQTTIPMTSPSPTAQGVSGVVPKFSGEQIGAQNTAAGIVQPTTLAQTAPKIMMSDVEFYKQEYNKDIGLVDPLTTPLGVNNVGLTKELTAMDYVKKYWWVGLIMLFFLMKRKRW